MYSIGWDVGVNDYGCIMKYRINENGIINIENIKYINKKEKKMSVKKEVKQSVINYRRYYINHLSAHIQDLLRELREINNMPENLIKEKIVEEDINIWKFKNMTKKRR